MTYSVDWSAEARNQLAAIWVLQVSSRRAITAAQARIDQLLAADPHRNGTAVSEGLYAMEAPPLRVHYEITDGDRTVTVVSVRGLP